MGLFSAAYLICAAALAVVVTLTSVAAITPAFLIRLAIPPLTFALQPPRQGSWPLHNPAWAPPDTPTAPISGVYAWWGRDSVRKDHQPAIGPVEARRGAARLHKVVERFARAADRERGCIEEVGAE